MLKYKKNIRYLKKNVLCKYEGYWFPLTKNIVIQKKWQVGINTYHLPVKYKQNYNSIVKKQSNAKTHKQRQVNKIFFFFHWLFLILWSA